MFRKRTAIDGYPRMRSAMSGQVNAAGRNLLARTGLPGNEQRAAAWRNQLDSIGHLAHGSAVADQHIAPGAVQNRGRHGQNVSSLHRAPEKPPSDVHRRFWEKL